MDCHCENSSNNDEVNSEVHHDQAISNFNDHGNLSNREDVAARNYIYRDFSHVMPGPIYVDSNQNHSNEAAVRKLPSKLNEILSDPSE